MNNKKDLSPQILKNSTSCRKKPDILVDAFWEMLTQLKNQAEMAGYNKQTGLLPNK